MWKSSDRREAYRVLTGDQPHSGTIHVVPLGDVHLPGYEENGTIEIKYTFPDGIQGPEHPNPGRPYNGQRFTAYLPANTEGQKVMYLLRKAFESRRTFTINDAGALAFRMPHKTSKIGGPCMNGYPDPGYLASVKYSLEKEGIR